MEIAIATGVAWTVEPGNTAARSNGIVRFCSPFDLISGPGDETSGGASSNVWAAAFGKTIATSSAVSTSSGRDGRMARGYVPERSSVVEATVTNGSSAASNSRTDA